MKRASSLTLAGALVIGAGMATKAHALEGMTMNGLQLNGLQLNGLLPNERFLSGTIAKRVPPEDDPIVNEALRDLAQRPIAASGKSPSKKK